jgi:D-lactate dehydrogenase
MNPNDPALLLAELRRIVGRRHVLTGMTSTHRYTTGYRFGSGPVVAVVRPGSQAEQWHVLLACVRARHIVIVQAANTGLTGGSTPHGTYDRDVVIINTMRLDGIHLIRGGRQVVCLAGATLHDLERKLAPLGRDPHSVIGSSCIGASVIGGICNNSGGALVQRGPAYTEYALYAQVSDDGHVILRNHLGIRLGDEPETILNSLEQGRFSEADIVDDSRAASATDYVSRVRDVHSDSPARFNADPTRLFEASGSAGRIMVFAVRLDTFPRNLQTSTFYVGTNDTAELTWLRRRILEDFNTLPESAEYIHRDAFDVAETYGKDLFLAIQFLGSDRLPLLFSAKSRIDSLARRLRFLPSNVSDRIMQAISRLFPKHLPARMTDFRDRFAHHLILKTSGTGIEEARSLLNAIFPSDAGDMFECSADEARKAFLHRFAVAGAAVRYRATHKDEVEDIVALDIALRRNDEEWFEHLPAHLSRSIIKAVYYGHFLCHVFHQDYILSKGSDVESVEHAMWQLLDARGAEYPAEHNVGHLYPAGPALAEHYRRLDPGNHLNPGIGRTSRQLGWT